MSHLRAVSRPGPRASAGPGTTRESLSGRLRRHHEVLLAIRRTLDDVDAALTRARHAQMVQAARNRMVLAALDSGDIAVLETVRAQLYGVAGPTGTPPPASRRSARR